MTTVQPLFSDGSLSDFLRDRENRMRRAIDFLDDEQILNTNPEELSTYFVSEYSLQTPVIDGANIVFDPGDTHIDVRHRHGYPVFDRTKPAYTRGIQLICHIPFEGCPELFQYQASRHYSLPPVGHVLSHKKILVITCESPASEEHNLRPIFDMSFKQISEGLEWVGNDVERFNASIKQESARRVSERRDIIIKARTIGETFGFKLRRRDDAPTTYAVPVKKRELAMPSQGASPWLPDPTLELEEYNSILDIIMNMSQVIERSPAAFQDMQEEHLRNHFLVQLNGQYEGNATGETFNFSGKSDILIRHEGKNLFVAECKFWDGSAALADSIDQLLGYITWRDTKTALLVFNKDRKLSTVLQAIEQSVPEHASFKRKEAYDGETAFRYILGHPDDPEREIVLTIMVFEVPR